MFRRAVQRPALWVRGRRWLQQRWRARATRWPSSQKCSEPWAGHLLASHLCQYVSEGQDSDKQPLSASYNRWAGHTAEGPLTQAGRRMLPHTSTYKCIHRIHLDMRTINSDLGLLNIQRMEIITNMQRSRVFSRRYVLIMYCTDSVY